MSMDVVDYEIKGAEMQFVEVELDPGEAAVGEAGSMFFMDAGITMDTVFGDGSGQGGGFFGKLVSAGKRLVTGESLFTTVYTNNASSKQRVAFGAPYPGKILPMDLAALGGTLICQKDAFLCAARGLSLGIALQQKMSTGFFGGEGFIMQKLDGDGLAFVHAGGTVVRRELAAGQTLLVDNRGGASGAIGLTFVAKSPADGHTLLMSFAGNAVAQTLMPRPGLDINRDFTHVTQMMSGANVLVAHPSTGLRNFKEFLALVKAKPGQLKPKLKKTRTFTNSQQTDRKSVV